MQMSTFDRNQFAFLKPKRLTVTVSYCLYAALEQRASKEGRSMSNLAAYLLENALDEPSAVR